MPKGRKASGSPPPDDYPDPQRLAELVSAAKTLTGPPAWAEDGRNLRFTATVDIEGITEPGLVLAGRASATIVDRHVSLMLVYHNALNLGGAIDRIDWKPVDAHVNKGVGPSRLRFNRIERTHRHSWELNATLGVKAVVNDLPVAEPVDPEPQDWGSLLHLAATCWRFADLSMVPAPPWQYGLLSWPPRPGGRQ